MGATVQLDTQRNFRLTSEEDRAINEIATERGMTASQLIRWTLQRALFLRSNGSNTPDAGAQDTITGTAPPRLAQRDGVTGNYDDTRAVAEAQPEPPNG